MADHLRALRSDVASWSPWEHMPGRAEVTEAGGMKLYFDDDGWITGRLLRVATLDDLNFEVQNFTKAIVGTYRHYPEEYRYAFEAIAEIVGVANARRHELREHSVWKAENRCAYLEALSAGWA